MAISKNKNITNFSIKFIALVAIIAIIWNIPPTGALTEIGMHTLACFAGIVYGLCFMKEYGIYNLLIVFIMAYSGAYSSMGATLIAAFGNNTFVMIFSAMLFVGVIAHTGLAKVLAQKMINARVTTGRPWMLTFVFLLAASVLSMFLHVLVVVMVLSELIVETCRQLKMKGNRWTMFVLADMCMLAITGNNIMTFKNGPVLFFGILQEYDERLGLSTVAGQYMLTQLLLQVILLAFCMLVTWLFCKDCVSELVNYKPSDEKFPLAYEQKVALIILVFFVAIQLFPLVLPAGSALRKALEYPGLMGYSIICSIIAMCLFKKDGSAHLVTFDELSKSGLSWYMLLMLLSVGVCVGPMTSDSSGIIQWLTDILSPIYSNLSPYGAYAMLIIFAVIATNLTDNIAVFYVVVPICYVVSTACGLNAQFVLTALVPAFTVGIILPSASPYIAYIYDKVTDGYVQKAPLMFWTTVRVVFMTVILLTLGWVSQAIFPIVG